MNSAMLVRPLRRVRAFVDLGIYLLLFLFAFEGPLLAFGLIYQGLAGNYSVSLLISAIACGVLALSSCGVFFVSYILRPASRSAAVLAVSIGIHLWAIAILIILGGSLLWQAFHLRATIEKVQSPMALGGAFASLILFLILLRSYYFLLSDRRQSAPRVALTRAEQPRLWLILENAAKRCNTELPGLVWWLPTPNAQVELIDGLPGLRKKRALGVGLPLLRLLSVDEFVAIIAHELQHLRANDPFVSRCIFQSRRYAHRLLRETSAPWLVGLLTLLLAIYAKAQLELSKPVQHRWEFEADAFAATVTSASDVARALVKLDLAQSRFDAFYASWVGPSIDLGFLPPVIEGFWEYYEDCAKQEHSCSRLLATYWIARDGDTHPPMRDRLDKLALQGNLLSPGNGSMAIDLLENSELIEAEVYGPGRDLTRQSEWGVENLTKLIMHWKEQTLQITKKRRGGIDLISLDERLAALPSTATYLGYEQRNVSIAERVMLFAFAAALLGDSWQPELSKGRLRFRKTGMMIDPAADILGLKTREIQNWSGRCERLGISHLALLPPVTRDPLSLPRVCSRCLTVLSIGKKRCPKCHQVFLA